MAPPLVSDANVRNMSGGRSTSVATIRVLASQKGEDAMRSRFVTVSMLALLVAGTSANAQPKGQHTTIKGEVVDLWCYLEGGDRGPAKKDCATACAKAGNPIGVLDAKGNLFVTAGIKDHQPAQ